MNNKERLMQSLDTMPEFFRNILGPVLLRIFGKPKEEGETQPQDWLPDSFNPEYPTNPLEAIIAQTFKEGDIKIGNIPERKKQK